MRDVGRVAGVAMDGAEEGADEERAGVDGDEEQFKEGWEERAVRGRRLVQHGSVPSCGACIGGVRSAAVGHGVLNLGGASSRRHGVGREEFLGHCMSRMRDGSFGKGCLGKWDTQGRCMCIESYPVILCDITAAT